VSSWSTALHEGVRGRGDIAPLIIHLGARCYGQVHFIPGERLYRTRYTGGWVDLRVALEVVASLTAVRHVHIYQMRVTLESW